MSCNTYLIVCHDVEYNPSNPSSTDQILISHTTKALTRSSKRVVLAASTKIPDCKIEGVEFWNYGEGFDIWGTFAKATRNLGRTHLLCFDTAVPLVLARQFPSICSRTLAICSLQSDSLGLTPQTVNSLCQTICLGNSKQARDFEQGGISQEKLSIMENFPDLTNLREKSTSSNDWDLFAQNIISISERNEFLFMEQLAKSPLAF